VKEELCRLLDCMALVCVWMYLCCCSGGCFCQDCSGLGLCIVSTVGLSVGGKCVGRRGGVVTGCGRIGWGGEDARKCG
jgi:hypothetical protein